jgi:hypothetical protein
MDLSPPRPNLGVAWTEKRSKDPMMIIAKESWKASRLRSTSIPAKRCSARPIAGGVRMEDEMRLSRSKSAEAGLAFAFALVALALAAPDSLAHAGSTARIGRYVTVHQTIDPRTTAEVPTTPALFWPGLFGSYVPAPRKPETDGLSRNPADCVKYGCVDSNG